MAVYVAHGDDHVEGDAENSTTMAAAGDHQILAAATAGVMISHASPARVTMPVAFREAKRSPNVIDSMVAHLGYGPRKSSRRAAGG